MNGGKEQWLTEVTRDIRLPQELLAEVKDAIDKKTASLNADSPMVKRGTIIMNALASYQTEADEAAKVFAEAAVNWNHRAFYSLLDASLAVSFAMSDSIMSDDLIEKVKSALLGGYKPHNRVIHFDSIEKTFGIPRQLAEQIHTIGLAPTESSQLRSARSEIERALQSLSDDARRADLCGASPLQKPIMDKALHTSAQKLLVLVREMAQMDTINLPLADQLAACLNPKRAMAAA